MSLSVIPDRSDRSRPTRNYQIVLPSHSRFPLLRRPQMRPDPTSRPLMNLVKGLLQLWASPASFPEFLPTTFVSRWPRSRICGIERLPSAAKPTPFMRSSSPTEMPSSGGIAYKTSLIRCTDQPLLLSPSSSVDMTGCRAATSTQCIL
uniref:Uncharacterized protein n=1 Tax=Peronospora matthiolae TaxID=2874970 RepID=A0AAV1VIE0_9STRA